MGWIALIAIAIAIVVMVATDYPVNFHKGTPPVQTSVLSAESTALADARMMNPDKGEFGIKVGLTADGATSPYTPRPTLRPGQYYEVIVPESRRDDYYVEPVGGCDARMVTVSPWQQTDTARSGRENWTDQNRVQFRTDRGVYTDIKFFATDHRKNGYLRIKFKVVPDERFPADPDDIANGRPLQDGE